MKTVIFTLKACIFLCLMGFALHTMAQENDSTASPMDTVMNENEDRDYQDTTTISFGRKSRITITTDGDGNRVVKLVTPRNPDWDDDWDNEDRRDDDWNKDRKYKYSEVGFLAFDIGVTNYYNDGDWGVDAATQDLELKTFRPGSHVALHILPTTVSLFGKGAVSLKTAITIDWSNYYFTEDVQLQKDQEELTFTRTGINYDKNKLMTRYAQIPLMLHFNTDPKQDEGVSLSVGGFAGILWGARTKQKSDEFGKQKVRDEFNLSRFKYGLTARLDFRWFDFYFNYNMNPLFDEDENAGINAQTFNAGINVFDF